MSVILLNVEDNLAPTFDLTLQRDSTAIDLSGASVDLIIKNRDTDEITNTGHTSCSVLSASSGTIRYTPQADDFPAEGNYLGEVKITHSGSRVERLYELVQISVRSKHN